MDLVAVILFLVLYYLRPQEWWGLFSTIHFVQIVTLAGLAALFLREKGLRPRDLFRTPHDWAVFAFWLWIVLSSPHRWETFKDNANLYVFYIIIVQALRSVPRLKIFAGWWTFLIVAVALLALASQWGFDPLGSYDKTIGMMRGRLCLNLSIFDNPNGLGHSVVPAIPMLFYYLIWRRPVAWRVVGVGLLFIPLFCIYLTVSKGAFLCAGVTIVATMAFGRPRSVQALMLIGAFLFGTSAIFLLPRMNELNKAKSDEAIQGRVAAFRHGYKLLQTRFTGVGKGEWGQDAFMTDYIPVLISPKPGQGDDHAHHILKAIHYTKAPHSSYVCTGGELGKPGLLLFIAVLYCCFRTTITARTATMDEERIRRMLFVLVISYVVSSWMVDFEYRPTFFMFTAAIAALHRHLLGLQTEKEPPAEEPSRELALPVWRTPQLLPQPALAGGLQENAATRQVLTSDTDLAEAPAPVAPLLTGIGWNWNRLGIFDFAAIAILTYGVIRFWAYIMERM